LGIEHRDGVDRGGGGAAGQIAADAHRRGRDCGNRTIVVHIDRHHAAGLVERHHPVAADRIDQQAFFVEAELAGARVVDIAVGVGEDEVTVAFDREIRGVAGLADVAGVGAQTFAGDARAAAAADIREERIAAAETRRIHVGDVVGDRVEASGETEETGQAVEKGLKHD